MSSAMAAHGRWQSQQFGLGFIREINLIFAAQATTDDYADGSKDGYAGSCLAQLYLGAYMVNAAVSAVNLALYYGRRAHSSHLPAGRMAGVSSTEDAISDLNAWAFAHAMLLLATVVHFDQQS